MRANGLDHFRRDSDLLRVALRQLEPEGSWDGHLLRILGSAITDQYDQVIACAETGRPFVANSFGIVPEVFTAMGLPAYSMNVVPFLPMNVPDLEEQIAAAESLGLGTDLCTVVRVLIRYVYAGYLPIPTVFVGALSPCDGASVLHQAVVRSPGWRDVPAFCTDFPYWKGHRGVEYFAGELGRMVDFVARQTGARLDLDRLREAIGESNQQYELWSEYRRLLGRTVPCPRTATKGTHAWHVSQNFLAGDPRGTEWFRKLVRLTELDIEAGRGDAPRERIRLLWFDIPPVWLDALTQWLRDDWGACIVMDMLGYAPSAPIDTSSAPSMLRGLAGRWLSDVPIARQAQGMADGYVVDISRIVQECAIDCVVWPGYMGHKDAGGSIGMVRQACAEIGVPFLELGLDLLDGRYAPIDELKDKFNRFFSTKGLG